jgi:sporulation protein YlmC with PRC-barrel domain
MYRVLLAFLLAAPVFAADPVKDKRTWLDMRASELIGKQVASREGKALGKIEDLIVDRKGGHIPHVILEAGDKLFVYPVNAFSRDEYRDRIVVNVEPRQLSGSQGFERSNWPFQPPLERASKLRGTHVQLKDGTRGELEDLVVNLGSGKVVSAIVAQDGRKGPEDKLVLPPSALGGPAR